MASVTRVGTKQQIEYPDSDGKPMRIARMKGFVSPRLGIRFEPGKGPDNLTILGRDGRPFPTPLELSQRAEAERQRADAERQRAERYAAKLRELGIEPD